MRLSKRTIDAITPPAKGRAFYRDDDLTGFAVRVTAGGTKTFVVEVRINGRNRLKKLDRYGINESDSNKIQRPINYDSIIESMEAICFAEHLQILDQKKDKQRQLGSTCIYRAKQAYSAPHLSFMAATEKQTSMVR